MTAVTLQNLTVYVSLAQVPNDPMPPRDEGDAESDIGEDDGHSV